MEATFEVLGAAGLDGVKTTYAPLTEVVRDLIDATIRTRADDGVIEKARSAIEAAANPTAVRRRGATPRPPKPTRAGDAE
ncbi:hypothetical protein AWC15_04465 [Mycobacterium lacus]|nr:hypothetical protein AWC15_04465 [Mycobacterium lacus]